MSGLKFLGMGRSKGEKETKGWGQKVLVKMERRVPFLCSGPIFRLLLQPAQQGWCWSESTFPTLELEALRIMESGLVYKALNSHPGQRSGLTENGSRNEGFQGSRRPLVPLLLQLLLKPGLELFFCLERDEDAVFHVLLSLGQAPVAWKMMGKVQGLIALFIKSQNKYRTKYCNMLLSMLKKLLKKNN